MIVVFGYTCMLFVIYLFSTILASISEIGMEGKRLFGPW